MRGTCLPPTLGSDPPAWLVALPVAAALTGVCGHPIQPEVAGVILPAPAYPAAAVVAAAISAEQVTAATVTPAGSIAVAVGAGYDRVACQQIVLAVAKVWHGLCGVHTPPIHALESVCPLPPPVAAWPWALEAALLTKAGRGPRLGRRRAVPQPRIAGGAAALASRVASGRRRTPGCFRWERRQGGRDRCPVKKIACAI